MATAETKGICSTGGESDDNKSQNSFSNRLRAQVRASTSTDTPRPAELPVLKDPSNIENVVPGAPMVGSSAEERKRSGKMWNEDEFSAYYEAIKIVGKDFDGIVKLMAKKKNVHRDKDQIRNYFFNCVKFVRNCIDVDMEGLFPDLCRDAKELFIVINSGEWRKRTGRSKYLQEKMRELIFEGVTTIKSNKRNLVLRTPSCPALSKFFTETRSIPTDKFTSDVVINLNPATNSDCAYVVACQQNPTLALRVNANDRLSRIFDLLNVKWRLRHAKDSKSIVLRPARSTEIGQVVVSEVSTDTEQVSLNRLNREMETKQEKTAKRDHTLPHNTIATYSAITPHPFTINEKMLMNGLGANDVGEASVAEMFCLCGMKPEFTMVYSIKSSRRRADGWQIFRELVVRDYGDQLTVTKEDDSRNSADGKLDARRGCRTGMSELNSERDAYLEQPEVKRVRTDSQSSTKNNRSFVSRRITPSTSTPVVQCKVGNAEDNDFINKFKEIRSSNKQNAKTRSRTKKGAVQPIDLAPAAPMGGGFAPIPSSGHSHLQPTDFSQLASTSSGQQMMHAPVKSDQNGAVYPPYFGQNSVDEKEYVYRFGAVPPRGMPSAEEIQQQNSTDEVFGDGLYSPMKSLLNNSILSFGSSESIQKMAQNEMVDVLCQNSIDLFQGINHLINHVDGDGEQHWANISNL